MTRSINENNSYLDKVLKQIPSEIVGLYLVVISFVPKDQTAAIIILGLVMVALTPVYLMQVQSVKDKMHLGISTGSMLVWEIAIGGFDAIAFLADNDWIKGILLILYTTVASWYLKPASTAQEQPAKS